MKAATYNPDTLKRINQGASARDLGWDDAFYGSVCRKHGLSPNIPSPKVHTVAEIAATAPLAPAAPLHPTIRTVAVSELDPTISRRERELLAILSAVHPGYELSVERLAAKLDVNRKTLKVLLSRLRIRVAAAGINIPRGRRNSDTGYCLLDAHTGARVVVEDLGAGVS